MHELSLYISAHCGFLQLRSAWGAAPLWPGEEKGLRVMKLPAGVSSLLVERGPNPKNENSAVWVTYQVRGLR
jgi:hypothetical protein